MIKLLELRTEKGMSQREMATVMRVSQGTYNNWENGRTQPSIEQLISLADYFEVSVDYLIGRAEEYEGVGTVELYSTGEKQLVRSFRSKDKETASLILELIEKMK